MAQINNIFNFLKEYNELSNPIVTEIDSQKWKMNISKIPIIDEVWSIYEKMEFDNEKMFEVKKPILSSCPLPPNGIKEWIVGDWKNPEKDILHKEKIIIEQNDEEENVIEIEILFKEDSDRISSFNEWELSRDLWRKIEIPKVKVLNVYNNLFKLYSDIKKESESVELILGDGIINWRTEERIIDHPVLLQKVILEFDSDKPSFVIKCDEIKTDLYTPMLRVVKSINQSMLSEVINDVESKLYHIADVNNNIGLFKRLINVVDTKGKYVESFESGYDGPMIKHEPVLFLRKRNLGYSVFIENILHDIGDKEGIELPDFFENMLGNHKESKVKELSDNNWNQSGIDQDVLLTLPANNEQLRIIKYLNSYGAVLVQGPPGTGKTHTIANLIGHLLSQGNSVLVTSHTEKALTVLKEKVFKDLQSLCISLLSSGSQKKEMDASLFEIAEKGTSTDLNEMQRKIKSGELERKKLINDYKIKNEELIQIRSLEYKDIVYKNTTIQPIDAAKFINKNKDQYGYIPGKTKDDTIGLPLTFEELKILFKSNEEISCDEEDILKLDVPNINDLWEPNLFVKKNKEYRDIKEIISEWTPLLLLKDNSESNVLSLLEDSENIMNEYMNFNRLQLTIIKKSITDSVYTVLWENILNEFTTLFEKYENWRKIHFENEINIPDEFNTIDTIKILEEILLVNKVIPVTRLNSLTKPKWKKVRDSIQISNKNLEKKTDYEKIRDVIEYELKRVALCNKVNKLMIDISDDFLIDLDEFEEKAHQNKEKIELSLSWYNTVWLEYKNRLINSVSSVENLDNLLEVDYNDTLNSLSQCMKSIVSDLNQNINNKKYKKLNVEKNQYYEYLNSYLKLGNPFSQFVDAFVNQNERVYSIKFQEIIKLYSKKDIYINRKELLNKLNIIAPEWTDDIRERKGIHGKSEVPENIEMAWKWRQLSNQLERLDSYDPNKIQKEIDRINARLIKNAKELAYNKAWFEKAKNTNAAQTQAIEGWRQTMKRLGKGTGKKAPMLMQKARELMPLCQSAIPVWIMPLSRVAENFNPQKNKFDVVIIDEASQADILALSALYIGKKVIIVGDDEQVSPANVGMKDNEISALIEQHLKGVPNNHLFTGKTSVYDMAKASGFKTLMLTEHFRCLPEIIEFSNQLSYNGKIKPLRDASGVTTIPSVVEYRVPNGVRDNRKTNHKEAEHIAALVCACVANENYKDKTIGVISLLGKEQAYEIDRLLQIHLDPKEYEKRRIQCGTPPQFQGDERDIIFLSIVEGPRENGGPVMLVSEDGRNDMYRKRYNVAASRAKDQMWVVHSLNPEIDLKAADLRLKLIKHAMNPSIDRFSKELEKAESDFEDKVMRTLLNKGYKVIPQWKVGAYRIDMVVTDGNNKIALECDGEKWHPQEKLADDLKRQAILERLGWKFIRIRGSAYYRYPEDTMDWVFNQLESRNIKPNFNENLNSSIDNTKDTSLVDDIKRAANAIRFEWNGKTNEDEINEDDSNSNIEDNSVENISIKQNNIDDITVAAKKNADNKQEANEIEKDESLILEHETEKKLSVNNSEINTDEKEEVQLKMDLENKKIGQVELNLDQKSQSKTVKNVSVQKESKNILKKKQSKKQDIKSTINKVQKKSDSKKGKIFINQTKNLDKPKFDYSKK